MHRVSSARFHPERPNSDLPTSPLAAPDSYRVDLFRQEVFAVCPPGTALLEGPITPEQLAAMPLIATPPGTSTRRLLERVISRSHLDPNIVVQIHHREAILPLVLAGAGVALLPAPMAEDANLRGAAVRPFRPIVTRRIGVVHRTGTLSPAAAAMLTLAKQHKPAKQRAQTSR